MANRSPLLRTSHEKGGMVYNAQVYNAPLLPFEKQLIETIGATEEEYRFLVTEAIRRGRVRPAGYEHIPDIRCEPKTQTAWFLINLAVGVTLTVVQILLTPKPKQPKFSRREGDDINRAGRFTPTFGFDTQQALANYGESIPIIFGKAEYGENGEYLSGGMLVSPKLVWSRMFSYGTQQMIKQMWVVGEQGHPSEEGAMGIAAPDLEGIFVGNGPLDAIYNQTFAFYWKRNTRKYTRINQDNLHYGTRATPDSGDPQIHSDIFAAPTGEGLGNAFCEAHSLSNNAEFGCYAPIGNGSNVLLNWQVVSMPVRKESEDDPGDVLLYTRHKISGVPPNGDVRHGGQPGTGRAYSRRMGIVKIRRGGSEITTSEIFEFKNALKDDVITFEIRPGTEKIPEGFYKGSKDDDTAVKVEDINSLVDGYRKAADDALQLGEVFQLGLTYWQVISRSIGVWRSEDTATQSIELKCIDTDPVENTSDQIGIVSANTLNPSGTYLGDRGLENSVPLPNSGFYPLLRTAKALIRNTRACEITEIGIRSKVFQQLNGLCNFESIPTPTELDKADRDEVQLTTGLINAYIARASAFDIYVRPSGSSDEEWDQLPKHFVIIGREAVDQYNWIRIYHPTKGAYEFQLRPRPGADLQRLAADTEFIHLTGAASQDAVLFYPGLKTNHGEFQIKAKGEVVTREYLKRNKEFITKSTTTTTTTASAMPSAVTIKHAIPQPTGLIQKVSSLYFVEFTSTPSVTGGRMGCFGWEVFGGDNTAPSTNTPMGGRASKWVKETTTYGREIMINYVATKLQRDSHYSSESHVWWIDEFNVRSPGGSWTAGETITIEKTLSGGNPFTPRSGVTITKVGFKLRVGSVADEPASQGIGHAMRWEVLGDPTGKSEGESQTVAIDLAEGSRKLRLDITSTIKTDLCPSVYPGIAESWNPPTVKVVENASYTSSDWNTEETLTYTKTVSAANLFRHTGTTVGWEFEIETLGGGGIKDTTITGERVFDGQSQYADISTYGDSLVSKSNANSPEHVVTYVNEIVENPEGSAQYDKMTTGGLALKASRSFSNLDQVRAWISNGIPVKHLHPDDSDSIGPSNLITDLFFFLLTDKTAGAGKAVGMDIDNTDLINTTELASTAKFLRTNKLFFDGALTSPQNFRDFVSELAPNFLCNFVISNGQFSLIPALPVTASGAISTERVPIKQIFTSGNILEDSFELNYLTKESRNDFIAVVRYRKEDKNKLPSERTVSVRPSTTDPESSIETFDLTAFCTSEDHAKLVGKLFTSVRRRVTHTISFQTTPSGLDLAPGDFIKVTTTASPYSNANNGTIDGSGVITSTTTLDDGTYNIVYYVSGSGSEETQADVMSVSAGKVLESKFYNSIFTVENPTDSENVYQVEQLTLDKDNLVQIVASEYPCRDDLSSEIAHDVLHGQFIFEP